MTNTDFENLRAHAQRGDYTNAHLARRVQELEAALDKAADELAAARAWAAAWKLSAKFRYGWRGMSYTYCREHDSVFARRAAEAMERR